MASSKVFFTFVVFCLLVSTSMSAPSWQNVDWQEVQTNWNNAIQNRINLWNTWRNTFDTWGQMAQQRQNLVNGWTNYFNGLNRGQ